MNLLQRRSHVSVLVTLAALVLGVLLAGQYVVRKHMWASETLAEIEPRYARLLGLRDAGEQLDLGLKQATSALLRLGYPADRDAAQVGNDLQQKARSGLQAAGLTVTSSQVLPARNDKAFERISVAVQLEGPLSRLQVALAALQAETPALAIDGLLVQPTGRNADDGSPIVSCRVTLMALRVQS